MNRYHTPGPWNAFYRHSDGTATIDAADGTIVAALPVGQLDSGEHQANAALIAAAPELLTALAAAVEAMTEMQEKHLNHCAAVTRAILQKRIDAARAAVREAQPRP